MPQKLKFGGKRNWILLPNKLVQTIAERNIFGKFEETQEEIATRKAQMDIQYKIINYISPFL